MSSGLAVVVLSLPFALAEGMSVSAGGIPGGAQPQAVPAAEYAGETTCLGCHEDKAYKGTAHSLALKERTPAANHGCETGSETLPRIDERPLGLADHDAFLS